MSSGGDRLLERLAMSPPGPPPQFRAEPGPSALPPTN
jgi:hypothetical protein